MFNGFQLSYEINGLDVSNQAHPIEIFVHVGRVIGSLACITYQAVL